MRHFRENQKRDLSAPRGNRRGRRAASKPPSAVTMTSTNGWRTMPPLPRDSAVSKARYEGPTDESNWVIPGILMAGAYPAAQEDNVHFSIIESILSLGITTFVCLQAEYEHDPNIPEFQWRQGYKLRTYIFDALHMLKAAEKNPLKRVGLMCPPSRLDFRHVPIVDCSTTNDSIVLELAQDIIRRLRSGENIYVHCWGGHGRAGTVISIVLGLMYELTPEEALRRCQQFHDTRRAPLGVPSPQTASQRNQVIRIIKREQAAVKRANATKAAEAAKAKAQQKEDEVAAAVPTGAGAGVPAAASRPRSLSQRENAPSCANTMTGRTAAAPAVKKPKMRVVQNKRKTAGALSTLPSLTGAAVPTHSNAKNIGGNTGNGVVRSLAPPTTVVSRDFQDQANKESAQVLKTVSPKVRLSGPGYKAGTTVEAAQMQNLQRAAARRPRPRKRPAKVQTNPSHVRAVVFGTGLESAAGQNVAGTSVPANGNGAPGTTRTVVYGVNGEVVTPTASSMPATKTRRVMGQGNRIKSGRTKRHNVGKKNNTTRYVKPGIKKGFTLNGANMASAPNSVNSGAKEAAGVTRPTMPAKGSKKQKLTTSPRTRNLIRQRKVESANQK
jgi:hypothetical protein